MPEIKLEHVTKRWGKFYAVEDLNLTIADNSFVTLLGPSGCGKSTFLKLLLRFWQKDNGEIKFGGVDVDSINTNELLKNVTMVSQTTYLFDETIEDNLRIAKPDATQEEIEAACRMASVKGCTLHTPPMLTESRSSGWLGTRAACTAFCTRRMTLSTPSGQFWGISSKNSSPP